MAIQSAGANIADALTEGLRGLTEWKMREFQEKKINQSKEKAREFYKSQGLHPGLADLPQSQQDLVLKEYLLREGYPQDQQQGQQQGQQQQQGNKPYWAQGVQREQKQPQQNQQGGMEGLLAQLGGQLQGPQSGMDRLKDVLTQGALQELGGGQNEVMSDFQPRQGQNTPDFQPSQPNTGMKPRRLSPEGEARERLGREKMAQQDRQFEVKQAQSKEQFESKQLHQKQNESKASIKELSEKKNALRAQRASLEKQRNLNNSKLMDSPEALAIRNFFGINYDFLKSPGTREFEGVGVNFLSNLKPFFGARPTNFDVQTYLKKLASTGDGAATRRALIRNYDLTLQADEALNDAKLSIIDENGGLVPHDLDIRAEKRAGKEIDHIWKRFVENTGTKELKAGSSLQSDQLRPGMTIEVNGKPVKVTSENIRSFK